MSEKSNADKSAPKSENKVDKKTSETVNLSAEELRKVSGGITTTTPPPQR